MIEPKHGQKVIILATGEKGTVNNPANFTSRHKFMHEYWILLPAGKQVKKQTCEIGPDPDEPDPEKGSNKNVNITL